MSSAEENEKLRILLPNENLEVSEENLELFFQTMLERQNIWYRRFIREKERPWTNDEILRDYKFTNIYRELDRNSQYQIENIFKVFYKTEDRKELIWRIMFFRFFNNPIFFEFIFNWTLEAEQNGYEEYGFVGIIPPYDVFNSDILKELLDAFRQEGGNPFTNAYVTNTAKYPGYSRDEAFAFFVIPELHKKIYKIDNVLLNAKNPEEIIEVLLELPSTSNFLAHEFYQDFTYAPRYSNVKLMKFDQDDFTNIGPGAESGIRWIFPNRKTKKDKLQAIYDLRDIAVDYLDSLGNFKYLGYDKKSGRYFRDKNSSHITLHQIEMWLCEFQKYKKMQLKIGKQRSRFEPKTISINQNKNKDII